MEDDPETKKLIENNVQCGVCKEGYTNKPFDMVGAEVAVEQAV